jgi:hypothetical protein
LWLIGVYFFILVKNWQFMAFSVLSESERLVMSGVLWSSYMQKTSWDKSKKLRSLSFAHVVVLLYIYSFGSEGVRQVDLVCSLKLDATNVLGRRRLVVLLVELGLISRFTVCRHICLFISTDGAVLAQKYLKEIKAFY